MKLGYNINTCKWYIRVPQLGSKSGWSDWCEIPRSEALIHIEAGWIYEPVS